MELTGVHILTTYQCTLQCDHCFVWGSPWQRGTMPLEKIRDVLRQARDLGTVESIYFEGGEPFVYYSSLLEAVRETAAMGFRAGIVSNGYWATSDADADACLPPFAGLLHDLSVSSDLYHWSEPLSRQAECAHRAAEALSIPIGYMSVAQPEATDAAPAMGKLPTGESRVMYRGRAAKELAPRAARYSWDSFTRCANENLVNPGRVHVDPIGNVHICQGISLGNLFETPLAAICRDYDPRKHPIAGPLLAGGPAGLARAYEVEHAAAYADACHLCDSVRRALRGRFPGTLGPDQMYGVA